jgi:hypothetical protein
VGVFDTNNKLVARISDTPVIIYRQQFLFIDGVNDTIDHAYCANSQKLATIRG